MEELIRRSDAIKAVNELTYPSSLMDVKRKLMDIPAVEPKGVLIGADAYTKGYTDGVKAVGPKRGEWIGNGDYEAISVKCSICRRDNGRNASNFCPHCGAKMKGADDE